MGVLEISAIIEAIAIIIQAIILFKQSNFLKKQNKILETQTKYLIKKENAKIKIIEKNFIENGYFLKIKNKGKEIAKKIRIQIEIMPLKIKKEEKMRTIFKKYPLKKWENYFDNNTSLDPNETKVFSIKRLIFVRRDKENSINYGEDFEKFYKKLITIRGINNLNILIKLVYENPIGEIIEKKIIENLNLEINSKYLEFSIEKIPKEKGFGISHIMDIENKEDRKWLWD